VCFPRRQAELKEANDKLKEKAINIVNNMRRSCESGPLLLV